MTKKGKAKPMFRLYEEGNWDGEPIVEMPYFKDKTKTCRQCRFLNDSEFCEDIGLAFEESVDLDTFRACEDFAQREV